MVCLAALGLYGIPTQLNLGVRRTTPIHEMHESPGLAINDPRLPRRTRAWAKTRAQGPRRFLMRTVLLYVAVGAAARALEGLQPPGSGAGASVGVWLLWLAILAITGALFAALLWGMGERDFQRELAKHRTDVE
jgi:hypothetical protein